MTAPANLVTYGRCQCRCECLAPAVVKVRSYRGSALVAAFTPWTRVCLECMPHLASRRADTDPAPGPGTRWSRAFATAVGFGTVVPLAAWGLMLLLGAIGQGESYLHVLRVLTVSTLAWGGVAAQWRYIRDGVR